MDFLMHWIQRMGIPNHQSSVHFFSTHFYNELANGGCDPVANWTTNQGINIFEKKMILIPVNIKKQLSLCAVINHCYIDFGGVKLYLDNFKTPMLIL